MVYTHMYSNIDYDDTNLMQLEIITDIKNFGSARTLVLS